MSRHVAYRGLAAALLAVLIGGSALAQEIREGAVVKALPDMIWFQDADKLARWQELKASGNAEALAAFEQDELDQRSAWRFTAALDVKVLGFEPATHRVHVEMETAGRMRGTDWFVDEAALAK